MSFSGRGRPIGTKNDPNRTATTKHRGLNMTWKRALKLEKIARLSADPAGYSNEQIAAHLGCTPQTVVLIRQTPQYHAKMLEIASGVISTYDADLRTDTDNARAELKSMVPSALMVIRNTLLNNKNPALQFKASLEVLDREGALAKVSKSAVEVKTVPNMQLDPAVSSNIMSLLANAPRSQSEADLAGFTSTAEAAGIQQGTMSDEALTTLEDLDIKSKKPN